MTIPGCAKTVLVVEDDTDIRDAIAEVLADGDYRPLCAANGVAALAELRAAQTRPCVILLDMMMPVMDGREFREEQVRDAALRNIPVIVLSAHAEANSAAAQMNAAGFLSKPVDLHILLDTVEQFCAADPPQPPEMT
jgi:two-component system, OmpR family, response regulator CpxR